MASRPIEASCSSASAAPDVRPDLFTIQTSAGISKAACEARSFVPTTGVSTVSTNAEQPVALASAASSAVHPRSRMR